MIILEKCLFYRPMSETTFLAYYRYRTSWSVGAFANHSFNS